MTYYKTPWGFWPVSKIKILVYDIPPENIEVDKD